MGPVEARVSSSRQRVRLGLFDLAHWEVRRAQAVKIGAQSAGHDSQRPRQDAGVSMPHSGGKRSVCCLLEQELFGRLMKKIDNVFAENQKGATKLYNILQSFAVLQHILGKVDERLHFLQCNGPVNC